MAFLPFDKKRSYGLLIGVGKRDEDSDQMAITAADADHLSIALTNFNLLDEKNLTTLSNGRATKAEFLGALDSMIQSTMEAPADLVVLYFSGHGSAVNGKYYLVCRDTTFGDIEDSGMEGSILVEKLVAIQCEKMLVLLDCCHAGGVTEVPIPMDESSLLQIKNRVILTACARSQVSYLSNPVSIFTYAVIEALGGKFLNGPEDKDVSVFSMAMDVRERVVALSEQVLKPEKIQKPQLNVFENSGTTNFFLARYPNGGPRDIRLFKEEFSAIKSYEGKALNMEAPSKPDQEYRNSFTWMITNNSIRDIGNGNFILQGTHGPVTIHNGISAEQLKDLLILFSSEVIKGFQHTLKGKQDPEAQTLEQKLETALTMNEQEKQMLEDHLSLLLEKLNALTRDHTLAYDTVKKFSLIKEIQQTNDEIRDVKQRLSSLT